MNAINHPAAILSLIADQGVVIADGAVVKWEDQSGCGNDALPYAPNSVGPLQPTGINGKPALMYGGILRVPLTPSDEYSFFFVVRASATKNDEAIFFASDMAPGARWAFGAGKSQTDGAGWGGSGNVNFGGTDYMPADTAKLISYIKTPSKWEIYCNGVFIRSVNDISTPNYSGTHLWCMGKEQPASGSYDFSGKTGQILILEEALKNGQRKKVEKEIMAYWGL